MHRAKGMKGILRWLFWRLRKVWKNVSIILRGDGGFSLPEINLINFSLSIVT